MDDDCAGEEGGGPAPVDSHVMDRSQSELDKRHRDLTKGDRSGSRTHCLLPPPAAKNTGFVIVA